ncbi:MAG TPA: isocitrate/isopropylmalate family dehydrogenase, partial [Anaerohalosphaeraceae bacterium]|nr:isocitrate/isopropylmalate family dehydrogenase [Anaerohalosphaeraceae bacterium]
MKTYKIAVIGGDGTGPEVIAEAVKVMDVAAAKFGFKTDKTYFDFGGERYKRTGETLPDSAIEELRKFDAILLG